MPNMAKRKRDASSSAESEETPSLNGDDSSSTRSIVIAENPYKVRILPYNESSKLPKAQHNWTAATVQRPVAAGAAECAYQVYPADKWEALRKYKNFVIADKPFGVGDYIYIYHGENRPGTGWGAGIDPNNWVAQVLEIRAHDGAHVYIRVFWMYWPDELPSGREAYHGSRELVASNHMEVMDALTVTDTADVVRLDEKGSIPREDLYWRLKLDVITGKISGLKKGCYCGGYLNPEERLIQCPHCDKFLHERCLLRDACSRAWFREKSKTSGPDQQLKQEASFMPNKNGLIPDSKKSKASSSISSQSSLPPPPTPIKQSVIVKGKKQKIESHSDPWTEQMEAEVEMRWIDGEETLEATGMATVTYDPINQSSQDITIGLRCLMPKCGKWLYEEPSNSESSNPDGIRIKGY